MTTAATRVSNFPHGLDSAVKRACEHVLAMADFSRREVLRMGALALLKPKVLLQKALHQAPIDPMTWFGDCEEAQTTFYTTRQSAIAALESVKNARDAESKIAEITPMLETAYRQMSSVLEKAQVFPGLMKYVRQDPDIRIKFGRHRDLVQKGRNQISVERHKMRLIKVKSRDTVVGDSSLRASSEDFRALEDFLTDPNLFQRLYGSETEFVNGFTGFLREMAHQLITLPSITTTRSPRKNKPDHPQAAENQVTRTQVKTRDLVKASPHSIEMQKLVFATEHGRAEDLPWFERAYAKKLKD